MNVFILSPGNTETWVSKSVMNLPTTRAKVLAVWLEKVRDNDTGEFDIHPGKVTKSLHWGHRRLKDALADLREAGWITAPRTPKTITGADGRVLTERVKVTPTKADDSLRFVTSAIFHDGNDLPREGQRALLLLLTMLVTMDHVDGSENNLDRLMDQKHLAKKAGMSLPNFRDLQTRALNTDGHLPEGLITCVESVTYTGHDGKTYTNAPYLWSLDWSVIPAKELTPAGVAEVVAEAEAILEAPITPVTPGPSTPIEAPITPAEDEGVQTVANAYRGAVNALRHHAGVTDLEPVTAQDLQQAATLLKSGREVDDILDTIAVAALGTSVDYDPTNMIAGLHYVGKHFDRLKVSPGGKPVNALLTRFINGRYLNDLTSTSWAHIYWDVIARTDEIVAAIAEAKAGVKRSPRYPGRVPGKSKYVTMTKANTGRSAA